MVETECSNRHAYALTGFYRWNPTSTKLAKCSTGCGRSWPGKPMNEPGKIIDELEKCLREQQKLISSGEFDRLEQMHTKIITLLEEITRQAHELDPASLERLHDIEKLQRNAQLLAASVQQETKDKLSRLAPSKRQLRAYRI